MIKKTEWLSQFLRNYNLLEHFQKYYHVSIIFLIDRFPIHSSHRWRSFLQFHTNLDGVFKLRGKKEIKARVEASLTYVSMPETEPVSVILKY